ncbi:apolipoprotein N-acyltransferase [Actinomyces gaoshouyii]|uniref:apolipoprotein N-acyltransferase n=1 Tax=Actinomyces gaoshouyii TaxID=1960083 RepID=UPI0027E4F464|nr:apolipoprotein N-acyltransferase [Actinomyces gaoshouyii]
MSTGAGPGRGERLARSLRGMILPTAWATVSGLALASAFAPLDWWWAAAMGVAGLGVIARGRTWGRSAWLGFVVGLAFFAPLLHFTVPAMGNALGWVALTITEASYLALLGAAWSWVSRLGPLDDGHGEDGGTIWRGTAARVAALAALWAAVEELRSSWPWGGFPFGRLAFAMADSPLLPLASIGGVTGLGLLVALIGALLAEAARALRHGAGLRALTALIAAGAAAVAPLAIHMPSQAESGALRLAAVQGSVADAQDSYARALEVTGRHADETTRLAGEIAPEAVDAVVWPENAADLDPRDHYASARRIDRAARAIGAPILVGAVKYEDDARYNDLLLWSPITGAGPYYRKHRPVPFAEYVPLRSWIRRLTTQVDRIGVDMLPGTGPTTLAVPSASQGRDVPLAIGICFEVAYDDLLRDGVQRGGEAIMIPTNNANFIGTSEIGQQIAQGRVQAVAHGRAVLQVSTTGTTAVISPRGVIEQELPDNEQSSLVAELPLRTTLTIADRLGYWPARLALIAGALLAITGMVSAGRRHWAAHAPRGGYRKRHRASGSVPGTGRSSTIRRKRT